MSDQAPNIKDIINNTKNFDKPYATPIPEGIHEVEVISFVEGESKDNKYKMITLTVQDVSDRQARITQMLEIQWIEGTLRLIKGLYTHNAEDKEAAKEKINKFFDGAKDEADLQKKCVEILEKLIEKGCMAWLRVEKENESDQYPDRVVTAYEPQYRWKTVEKTETTDTAESVLASGKATDEGTDDVDPGLFDK